MYIKYKIRDMSIHRKSVGECFNFSTVYKSNTGELGVKNFNGYLKMEGLYY